MCLDLFIENGSDVNLQVLRIQSSVIFNIGRNQFLPHLPGLCVSHYTEADFHICFFVLIFL